MKNRIPKTMFEAKKEVAKLYLKYLDFRNKVRVKEGHLTKEEKHQLEYLREKIDSYCIVLYSLPWFRKKMKAWMVDVKYGSENIFSGIDCITSEDYNMEDEISLLLEKPNEFVEKSGGAIMKQVRDFIESHGFKVTDGGGGCCGGHIGCPCTDSECEELLVLLHINFKKAIESGIILPKVQWFKPGIFANDNETEEWIEKHQEEFH